MQKKWFYTLKVLFFIFILQILTFNLLSQPVNAVSTGTLTIVSSGGSAENTNWTYSAGEINLSASVSINASDIVSKLSTGSLIINADAISVQASIDTPTSNSLTLKSTGNINVSGGVIIETEGGAITLWSDTDSLNDGSIRLGAAADTNTGEINSKGGSITLSGGSNTSTGYAMASSDISASAPRAGVAIYGFKLNASGGDISIRGSTRNTINSSTRAVIIQNNAATSNSGKAVIETTSAGLINVDGDGSAIGHNNAWGPTISGATFQTTSGSINIYGKGNVSKTNARGIVMGGNPVTFTSTEGNINLNDTTDGSNSGYTGLYFSSTITFNTNATVTISADEIVSGGTWVFNNPTAVIQPYTGTNFTTAQTIGNLTATSCQNLTIGKSGNSSNITLDQGITINGPFTVYGANIAINGAITSSSSNIFLYSSGAVTQTAAIVSSGLALSGSGSFTLNNSNNNFVTLAGGSSGNKLGATSITDLSGGLTIGQVGSFTGLYSSAAIEIATTSGDLNIVQPVQSTLNSGDSILMYANKTSTATNAGDGNIKITGSGSISVEPTARGLFYSGTRPSSTGLVNQVGGESNTRSEIDSTSTVSAIVPAVASTGVYAFFRTSDPSPSVEESSSQSIVVSPTPTIDAIKKKNKRVSNSKIQDQVKIPEIEIQEQKSTNTTSNIAETPNVDLAKSNPVDEALKNVYWIFFILVLALFLIFSAYSKKIMNYFRNLYNS